MNQKVLIEGVQLFAVALEVLQVLAQRSIFFKAIRRATRRLIVGFL